MGDDLRLWLREVGLEQHAEAFAANDIDLDLLPDLSVELEWLKLKAESTALTLEEYEESLPDGDCAAVRYVPPAPTFSSSAPVADHISS